MRKSAVVTILCALGIVVGTSAHAATITVFHGTRTEVFDTAKVPAGGVRVLRLDFKSSAPIPVAAKPSAPARSLRDTYLAGNNLWKRDPRTGRIVACAFGSSGQVGKYIIRCTDRDVYGR